MVSIVHGQTVHGQTVHGQTCSWPDLFMARPFARVPCSVCSAAVGWFLNDHPSLNRVRLAGTVWVLVPPHFFDHSTNSLKPFPTNSTPTTFPNQFPTVSYTHLRA